MSIQSFFSKIWGRKDKKEEKPDLNSINVQKYSIHEIYNIVCKAWNTLDVDLLTPLLSDTLYYESSKIGRAIKGKKEYVKYITGKFETLSKSQNSKVVAEVKNENGTERPFLTQDNINAVLEIEVEDGLIQKMLMRPPYSKFTFESFDKDFPELFNIAGKTLDEYFHKEAVEGWSWIQTAPPQIRFQDLCLSYGKYVLCIVIGLYRKTLKNGEETYLNSQEYENLLSECKKNNLTPCLFIMDSEGQPVVNGCHLLDARTFSVLDLNDLSDDNGGLMSSWEINNIGIACVCDYIKKQGYSVIGYCDVVGIEPQIWFTYNNEPAYIMVRSIPAGLSNNKYIINENELKRYQDSKGFFIDIQWNALLGNNGDFQDTILYRGADLIHNSLKLIEIEQAISNYNFIQVIDMESYIVKDNRKRNI